MASIETGGSQIRIIGELPTLGEIVAEAAFVTPALVSVQRHGIAGERSLNGSPCIVTEVCQPSVREPSVRAANLQDVTALHISKDLPFAPNALCGPEGAGDVSKLSTCPGSFRADDGTEYLESPFEGRGSRCIVVLDAHHRMRHIYPVPSTDHEPDYEAALATLQAG